MSTDAAVTPVANRDRDHDRDRLPDVGVDDVLPVRSRVSWGAILAGAVLALALYFLLTLLGAAIGLSVGPDTDADTLGTGAAIWAIVVTALCLFAGGYLASEFTVGESKVEGAVYGALVWAAVFAMLLWLMASGVRAGFNAMVGVATAGGAAVGTVVDAVPADAAANVNLADLRSVAQRAGFEQAQIDQLTAAAETRAREAANSAGSAVNSGELEREASQTAEEIVDATATVTWLTFAGTLLSMLAAVLGGYLGAGPTFRLIPLPARRRVA
ncbi:hypothetical protein [Alienimonas californiensis]|uniref:PhnA-like protein n=1 Tax=Alienimonas californiensis TaxID=2527989 RepID=A0A517PD38_9PLAN|nr:hypothetical protein [Alienimonas californiensis]QDT17293.1 hypothetical protein CA12_34130 [Alienimonas californiensis]